MKAVSIFFMLGLAAGPVNAQSAQDMIEKSVRDHAPPAHVYEEQVLLLTDRHGQRTVRTLRYYARNDESGSRSLRSIETPADARGAAIYMERPVNGPVPQGGFATRPLFGSIFLTTDLEGEFPADFRYERESDQLLDRVPHHVVRAISRNKVAGSGHEGIPERRIYLRKDNLFINRIDYLNQSGQQVRRLTFRDPQPDESGAWRARMILMEDLRDGVRALLKVERRVHSEDYVPENIFARSGAMP